jgi:hypothetical protein
MARELRLHVGRRFTGISIVPVCAYPKMWRIRWPDGQLSPMGNITRAKEAAVLFARARARDWTTAIRWTNKPSASEAPPAAILEESGTRIPEEQRPAV